MAIMDMRLEIKFQNGDIYVPRILGGGEGVVTPITPFFTPLSKLCH